MAGSLTADATDPLLLTWRPLLPLSANGADDGEYSITVTPVDRRGNVGASVSRTLVYDTQLPQLTGVAPVDINQQITYRAEPFGIVSATLQDQGPAGLAPEDQSVALLAPDGSAVPGTLWTDGTGTVRWLLAQPFPTDGSADGTYTVRVQALDRAGNARTWEFQLQFDTVAPRLTALDPAAGSSLPRSTPQITATLDDGAGSGVDFVATTVRWLDPAGQEVAITVSNDGAKTLIFGPDEPLQATGTHRFS